MPWVPPNATYFAGAQPEAPAGARDYSPRRQPWDLGRPISPAPVGAKERTGMTRLLLTPLAGLAPLPVAYPRLAPWALICRPLRGLTTARKVSGLGRPAGRGAPCGAAPSPSRSSEVEEYGVASPGVTRTRGTRFRNLFRARFAGRWTDGGSTCSPFQARRLASGTEIREGVPNFAEMHRQSPQ